MAKKGRSFISDGLSIDETRISFLLLTYGATLIPTIYLCLTTQDVQTLASICFALITGITTINITNILSNKRKTNDLIEPTDTDKDLEG
jgi:hypothetical protein